MEIQPLPFRKPASPEPPSLRSLIRAVIATGHATLDRSVRAADYAATTWANDVTIPLILRASVSPTLMANTTALSPIVQQFVEALGPLSAGGALANAGLALTSFGRGLVSVPSFAPGEAGFVAEGAPIPAKQFVSSSPTLTPFKLSLIVTLSAELLEHSDAETLVRAALTESVALGLDRVLFSASAAVAGQQPAGLLNGIAGLTPTVGASQDSMAQDVTKLLNAIAPVAGAGFLVIAAPSQAASLQFRLGARVPNVVASSALAAGTIIAIAPRAFVSIFETPRIEASIEALVHEETVPLAIGTVGAPATVAAPARSLYQTNSVGLRMITPVSWALRAAGAVAWMSAVNW